MLIREMIEQNECQFLSPLAALAVNSRGRKSKETECPLRTVYMRDRDRIIHSEAFRRLKHKTQVFFSPSNDHFRTRLTHTLEVSQISRTVAKALRLNEDLTEALALGHDLGKARFGHAGERTLAALSTTGFHHALQSYRIVDFLDDGGFNLTFEVHDGILKHSKRSGPIHARDNNDLPATLEGEIVRMCDRIAYLNHDLDDSLRADILRQEEIPEWILEKFGQSHSRRIHTMVEDLIRNSREKPRISLSSGMAEDSDRFKDFMYKQVYHHPAILEESRKTEFVLSTLFRYFIDNPRIIEEKMGDIQYPEPVSLETMVIDYLSMMTDDFAMLTYENYILPKKWFIFDRSKPDKRSGKK